MPRITAATVPEHHQHQRDAILDAVGELLADQGYAGLELAAVGRKVGLARTSIYRYAGDKDHLIAQWLDRALEPAMQRGAQVLDSTAPAEQRLVDWAESQLEFATERRQGAAVRLMAEFDGLPESIRHAITAGHEQLNQRLQRTVREALEGQSDRDAGIVVTLFNGIAGAASARVGSSGPTPELRAETRRAILRLVSAQSDGISHDAKAHRHKRAKSKSTGGKKK